MVLATGLQRNVLGDIAIRVDNRAVLPGQSLSSKGRMLGDVPDLAMAFGCAHAPWTLVADPTAGWVCRLLNHMQRHGQAIAMPLRGASVPVQPFLSFTSGYVQRAAGLLPQQGMRAPWQGTRATWPTCRPSALAGCMMACCSCAAPAPPCKLSRSGCRWHPCQP